MALTKANSITGKFKPVYDNGSITAFFVEVGFHINDDTDGSGTPVEKVVDIWPTLNASQKTTLTNLTNAIRNTALQIATA